MKRTGILAVAVLLAGGCGSLAYEPWDSRFDVGADTVRDTSTGLTWQRQVPTGRYTWNDAGSYCAGLSLSGAGWRLPTKDELLGIVDERYRPTIAPGPFPDTPSYWFWSSTAFGSSRAWYVNFFIGNTNNNDVGNNNYVRCVR